MVEAFSLLAIGTSLIGTVLGFSEFFKEQLTNYELQSPSVQILLVMEVALLRIDIIFVFFKSSNSEITAIPSIDFSLLSLFLKEPKEVFGVRKWWDRKKISFASVAMVVAPSILVSTTVPDAFSAATDIAVSGMKDCSYPHIDMPILNIYRV